MRLTQPFSYFREQDWFQKLDERFKINGKDRCQTPLHLRKRTLSNTSCEALVILQDTYSVGNVSSTELDLGKFAFFYGKYRGMLQLHNTMTKDMIYCVRAYFTLLPKVYTPFPT